MITNCAARLFDYIFKFEDEGVGLSITDAAAHLKVNRTTLSRLLNAHAGVSPDMALRLLKLLPTTNMILWVNLQRDYDIWVVKKRASKIRVHPLKAA